MGVGGRFLLQADERFHLFRSGRVPPLASAFFGGEPISVLQLASWPAIADIPRNAPAPNLWSCRYRFRKTGCYNLCTEMATSRKFETSNRALGGCRRYSPDRIHNAGSFASLAHRKRLQSGLHTSVENTSITMGAQNLQSLCSRRSR